MKKKNFRIEPVRVASAIVSYSAMQRLQELHSEGLNSLGADGETYMLLDVEGLNANHSEIKNKEIEALLKECGDKYCWLIVEFN
jgi:hypothetical protein